MENCPICGKPVEDAPPNVAVHAECWLKKIMSKNLKEEMTEERLSRKLPEELRRADDNR